MATDESHRVFTIVLVTAATMLAGGCASESATTDDPTSDSTGPRPSESSADATEPEAGPSVTSTSEPARTTTSATAQTTAASAAEFVPVTQERTCPEFAPAETVCSWVEVPADYDEPDGERVRLPVAVIPASVDGDRPDVARRPDPIVIPAGGPGFAGSEQFGWDQAPHNDARDIVLYDQRGTGLAEPSLECPGRDAAWVANLQQAAPFDSELMAIVDASEACRQRLLGTGIDLADYDSETSVRDLESIRIALGYEEWNIVGISYGARLALAAMRSAPDSLRSVVLDSVSNVSSPVGPAATIGSAERAFEALADACDADSACAAAFGDVEATIYRIAAQWDDEPIEIDVDLQDGQGSRRWVVTGGDLLAGIFNAMYDQTLVPLLPSILAGFEEVEFGLVTELIRRGVDQGTGSADGMGLAVNCADVGVLQGDADRATRSDPGGHTILAAVVLCEEWPVPPSPGFTEPVVSDIPALVLAGAFDPITPPAESEAAAEALPNSTYLLFPTAAHGVTNPGQPCALSISIAFLDDPTNEPDTSCHDPTERVTFAGTG